MPELKKIPKKTISLALEKALRYRLLNEPQESESICRDVLAVEPDHQEALVTLLLAVTDQFNDDFATALDRAHCVLDQLQGEYDREYYAGIIHERWANAHLARRSLCHVTNNWFREAMRCFEKAEALSDPDNPDALLRWNTCARMIDRGEQSTPADQMRMSRDVQESFGDDVPIP